jgi:DNA-binding transcriptional ArsR family regulator
MSGPIMKEKQVLWAGKAKPQPSTLKEEFFGGPVPITWLIHAHQSRCGYIGMILQHRAKMDGEPFYLGREKWAKYGIYWRTALRALSKLEEAGLITLERDVGKAPRIRLVKPKPKPGQRATQPKQKSTQSWQLEMV